MTSASFASGTEEHPEVTEISALLEGLLPADRSADVHAHLSTCSLCADVHGSLEGIRGALGTLPPPKRMPEEVASRIDAALAAEALLDATASEVSRETHPPGFDAGQTPPIPTPAGPPGHVVSRETRRPAPDRPPNRTRGASRPTDPPRATRRRRRRLALLGAASVVAALGLGGVLVQSGGFAGGDTDSRAEQNTAARTADEPYRVEERVRTLLEGEQDDRATASTPASGAQEQAPEQSHPAPFADDQEAAGKTGGPSRAATTVPPCIRQGIGRAEPALAADQQIFDGKPAYLVVLPHSADSTRIDAYVVEASCVGAPQPSPGTVLATGTYPRR